MSQGISNEEKDVGLRDWKIIIANWVVQQSFSVIVALCLLGGIWHIATVIAPQQFREITDNNTQLITRAIGEMNSAFERRTEMVISAHDKDRAAWETSQASASKDRELMIELIREQLKLTKQVENKMQ